MRLRGALPHLPGTPPCTFSLVDSQAERLPREHHSLCPRPTEYAAWTLQVARRSIKTMMVTSEPSGDTGGSPEDLSGRVRAPCPCGDPGALDWPGFPGTPVSTSSSPSPWTARQPLPRALVPELSKGKEKIRASLYARNCTQGRCPPTRLYFITRPRRHRGSERLRDLSQLSWSVSGRVWTRTQVCLPSKSGFRPTHHTCV